MRLPRGPPPSSFQENDSESVLHYPPPTPDDQLPTSSSSGKNWVMPKEMENCKLSLEVKEPLYPLRKAFLKMDSTKPPVLTNHFQYDITVKKLYEYQILDFNDKDRRKIKEMFTSAIDNTPYLDDNRDKFATNYLDTIVAWEDLQPNLNPKDTLDLSIPTGGDRNLQLRFLYVDSHQIGDLRRYAVGDPNYVTVNATAISKCLNILLSTRFDPALVHQQSSNKFFVKKARASLGSRDGPSRSLEIMRGYYYNIKEGMGNIILNFNLATSAFYRPILVSEFLSDTRTFRPDKLHNELKSLRVVVVAQRKPSTDNKKTGADTNKSHPHTVFKVTALSKDNIEEMTFHKRIKGADGKWVKDQTGKPKEEEKESYVIDYIRESECAISEPLKNDLTHERFRRCYSQGTKGCQCGHCLFSHIVCTRAVEDCAISGLHSASSRSSD